MSELITPHTNTNTNIRRNLLATVSALTLLAVTALQARAEDTSRPTVWIELGGQLSRLGDGQEAFAPEVMNGRSAIFKPSQKFEKPPKYGLDGTGSISIQPGASDWVLTASVRYGREKAQKHLVQQTSPLPFEETPNQVIPPVAQKFADTKARNTEQHVVLDFTAGRDVGVGLFGRHPGSVVSAGVRFASFTSGTNISLKSDPDWHFQTKYNPIIHIHLTNGQPFHSNLAEMTAERSFHGIGPTMSWKSSEPVVGNPDDGALMFDWGVNAALLFGRQKTDTHHQSTIRYLAGGRRLAGGGAPAVPHTVSRFPATPDHTRSRSITVPNIGAFAGLSFKYPNAKVSFGYRADFFFGAMDGGIDTRKTYDRNFYGPFATVSIGLGG